MSILAQIVQRREQIDADRRGSMCQESTNGMWHSMAGIARELVQAIRECFPVGEYEITMASSYEHNMLSATIGVPHATLSEVDLAGLAKLINRLDGELDPAAIEAIRAVLPGELDVYRMFMGAICHVRLRPITGHK